MPNPYNAQLPILSDWMGKMKLGKALSKPKLDTAQREKEASPSNAMILITAKQEVLDAYLFELE